MTWRRLGVQSCIAFLRSLPNPLRPLPFTPQDLKYLNSAALVLGDVLPLVRVLQTQMTH